MEEWPKEFFEMLDSVALMVDEFFLGVAEAVETVAEQVQNTIVPELDEYLQEIFEPLADIYSEIEEVMGEADSYIVYTYTEEPTLLKNPACMGCRHYHGQVYGGNLLVCGMHPYGWEDKHCPDWESFTGSETSDPNDWN